MPPIRRHFQEARLLALGVLALLVSDTAAGLASRLARGLALTAATVFCAFAKVAGRNSLDVFHDGYLHKNSTAYYIIKTSEACRVRRAYDQ